MIVSRLLDETAWDGQAFLVAEAKDSGPNELQGTTRDDAPIRRPTMATFRGVWPSK
jgi:hypothetical protein